VSLICSYYFNYMYVVIDGLISLMLVRYACQLCVAMCVVYIYASGVYCCVSL